MNLYERFIDFTKENEIETRDLGHQREDGYDLVVFGKTANKDNGLIYKIVFIFYDNDNLVDFYIIKSVKVKNRVYILERLNDRNSQFRGASFFLNGNLACMKSYCATGGYIRAAIMMMEKVWNEHRKHFPSLILHNSINYPSNNG